MTNTDKAIAILIKAREIISSPDRWTTGYAATDYWGNEIDVESSKACRFCSIGAIRKASGPFQSPITRNSMPNDIAFGALLRVATHRGFVSLSSFNDTQPHAKVIEAFGEAINQLRAQ